MQGPLSLKNKMLSTPLLNLSKASTPVRTRIISSNSGLNSTPINQLKFTTTVSRSPASKYHNKQKQNNINMNNNYLNVNINNELNKNQQKYQKYQKYQKQALNLNNSKMNKSELISKVNLSPILQLNRKMNQGPLLFKQNNMHKQSFRSLTPNSSYYHKKQDSYQNNMSQSNISISNYQSENVTDRYSQSQFIQNNNNIKNNNQLKESKQINKLLKGSNSFTNLLGSKSNYLLQSKSNNLLQSKSNNLLQSKSNNLKQSRNKTATRLGSMAFGSLNKKNSMVQSKSSGILRDSNNFLFSQLANKQNSNPLKLDSSTNPFIKMSQSKKSLLNNKSFEKKSQLQLFNSPKQNSSFINQKNLYLNNNNSFLNQNSQFVNQNSSFVNKNNYIQQSQLRLMCMNHQNKKAKYKVVNEEIVYCSKCAMEVIQRGISVEQLQIDGNLSDYNSPDRSYQNYSQYNSPVLQYDNFNQSITFKAKFQSFKPQPQQNNLLNQSSNTIQQLKNKIKNHKQIISTNKQTIERSVNQSISQMDNYYDSLIKYIDYQRQKDKQQMINIKLKNLMNNNNTQQGKFNEFINQLDYMNNLIKKNNINNNNFNSFNKQLQHLKMQIQQNLTLNYSEKINQNITIININQSIQDQFNQFVQIFDQHLKFKYNHNIHQSLKNCYQSTQNYQNKNKPFKNNLQKNQLINTNKNQQNYINENKINNMNRLPVQQSNGLRFSFQKALQNQNNKKRVLLQSKMRPLQQQPQQQQSQQQNSMNNNNCDWNYSQNTINLQQSQQNSYEQKIIQNLNNSDQNQYYYEQNSFHHDCIQNMINHNHNQQNTNNNSMNQKMSMYQDNAIQNYDEQQKPFRTLFVSDDQILCQNQNYIQNNNILQNRCTVIDLGIEQDQQNQNHNQHKKNIQSPVFKTR